MAFYSPYVDPYTKELLRQKQMAQAVGVTPEMQQQAQMESRARRMGQDFSGQERQIESQRAYADSLRGGPMPQGREVGPLNVYMAPNWGEVAAGAGKEILGGYLSRKAGESEKALDTKRSERAFEKAMQAMEQQEKENIREEREVDIAAGTLEERISANLREDAIKRQEMAHRAARDNVEMVAIDESGDPDWTKTREAYMTPQGLMFDKETPADQAKWMRRDDPNLQAATAAESRPKTATAMTAEFRAGMFGDALAEMDRLIDDVGYDPTTGMALVDKLANKSDLTRWASSAEGQQYQSTAETLKEQALRTATGAAAPKSENEAYLNTLIPGPWDDQATLDFKRNKLRNINTRLNELAGKTTSQEELNTLADRIIEEEKEIEKEEEAESSGGFKFRVKKR